MTKKAKKNQSGFYTVLGLVAAVFLVFIIYQVTKPNTQNVTTVDPSVPLPEAAGYLAGNPDAPVKVIEFADFECSACGQYFVLTEPDVRKRLIETGQISYRYFDFPLAMHRNTWAASNAAACANEQGKFWEMHDQLFMQQDKWNGEATSRPKSPMKDYAKAIGLDVDKWETCFDQQKYLRNIQANKAEAERRLVGSTPTFLIGSRLIAGSISYDKFKAYVDSAMLEAKPVGVTPDTAAAK